MRHHLLVLRRWWAPGHGRTTRHGSLVIALALCAVLVPRTAAVPPDEPDIIVVGAGISGLSAALEAARGGARVHVVEMSSVFGGHAVMAHGGMAIVDTPIQRAQGIDDSPHLAEADFLAWGEDSDRDWVKYYTRHSREEIYDWLLALGVTFSDHLLTFPGNSVPRFHGPAGRGLGLVSPIYRACLLHPAVEFTWNVKVVEVLSEAGRITGVAGVSTRNGERVEFRAGHVVLATGGFQSNLDMVRAFWPERYPFPERMLVGSGVNSVGSGHRIARSAGAALRHMDRQWNYATGLPDPRYSGTDRGINASNGASIWVNLQGQRFVNETASTKERVRGLLQQRPARYWAIFDEPGKRRLFVSGSDWADFETVEEVLLGNRTLAKKADSLEALTRDTELPPGSLARTVARYNRMVRAGVDEDFQRFGFGGLPYDLAPGSEEGAVPIETPPFYALSFYPLARKSMGGVAIDLETRVLGESGQPIPGLYAVGELAGFGGINGWAGLEGTFLGPSIVTGRIAARTILGELQDELSGTHEAAPVVPVASPDIVAEESPSCVSCHDVGQLLKTPRPGFWHFEAVHRVVTGRSAACEQCHASMRPFSMERHTIDRLAQIDTCAQCHLAQEH